MRTSLQILLSAAILAAVISGTAAVAQSPVPQIAFEAVADLCEMSARKDPSLQRFSTCGNLKIAACFPRAVKWLFASANAPLPVAQTQILHMRVQSAEEVCKAIENGVIEPNLPAGKATVPPVNELPATEAVA